MSILINPFILFPTSTETVEVQNNITPAYDIERAQYTDLGFSDEFDSTTLNSQWTAGGSGTFTSGTVDLLGQPSNNIYDLSTMESGCLFQMPFQQDNGLRLDTIPGDGEEFVISLYFGPHGAAKGNDCHLGFYLTDSANDPKSSGANAIGIVTRTTESTGWGDFYISIDGESTFKSFYDFGLAGNSFYIRVINSGGTIYGAYSKSGENWRVLGSRATTNLQYTWIFVRTLNQDFSPGPIHAVNWFRHVQFSGFIPY